MMPNKIGFIDSGIGGLNILKKYLEKRPNNEYIYFGDTLHLPYGDKSKEELIGYATKIIDFLIVNGVKTVVLACGTLCSVAYDDLVKKYPDIKIINIIDNTCKYLNKSSYKNIGLIATENTIKMKRFNNKLNKHIISKSTPMLVPIIENREVDKYNYYIDYYLKDMKHVDALILGCTHYIVLKDAIKEYIQKPIIDMSLFISDEIDEIGFKSLTLYFSKITPNLVINIKDLLGDIAIKEISL